MDDKDNLDKALEIGDKVIGYTGELLSHISKPQKMAEDFLYSAIQTKGYIDEEDFKKAALMLNVRKICKRTKNYYSILEKSDFIVEKNKGNQYSTPDIDWLEYFEDLSSKVSDDKLQDVWAKLLSKERLDAGSVTKVMLNTFSLLDKYSASAFGKLCNLTFKLEIDDGRVYYIPLLLYDDILHGIITKYVGRKDYQKIIIPFEEYSFFIPKQEEIEYLSDLNLIKSVVVHDESEVYSFSPMKCVFSVNNVSFEAKSIYDSKENYHFISTGQTLFTQTGLALYYALSIEPYKYLYDVLEGYISYVAGNWSET